MPDLRIKIEKFDPRNPKVYRYLLDLLISVYKGTNGRYPAMEWLKPEEKPNLNSDNLPFEFKEKYGSFLKWRLNEELDEVYLAMTSGNDNEVIGSIALNYNLKGKNIPWIPKEFEERGDIGFIELFTVHPAYQGKGIGKMLFEHAIKRLKEMKKIPCVVTFPNLEAINFYEKFGGRLLKKYDPFVLYCF